MFGGASWTHYGVEGRAGLALRQENCIQDSGGAVWVGTGGGLMRFENGKTTLFNAARACRTIPRRSSMKTRGRRFWAGSPAGLTFRNGDITTFGAEAGSLERRQADHRNLKGNLWLGTESGILRVSRAELDAYKGPRGPAVRVVHYGAR